MSSRPRPRIVALDLGGVVVDVDKDAPARALGIPREGTDEAFFHGALHTEVTVGALDGDEFLRAAAERLGKSTDLVGAAWAGMVRVRDDVEALFSRLDTADVQVSVWSNTDPIHLAALGPFLPSRFLSGPRCVSFALGAEKPSRDFFTGALRRLEVPPQAVVFFDDRPENVAAAEALGIDAVVVRSPAEVLATLERRGLV